MTEASQGSVLGCEDSDLDAFPADVSSSPSSATIPGLGDTPKPHVPKVTSDSFISSLVSDRERTPAPQPSSPEEPPGDHQEAAPVSSPASPGAGGPEVPWSNVDLEGAEGAQGAQAEGPSLATAGATGPPSSVATYPLGLEPSQGAGEEEGPVWAWITGGGCDVDSSSQISWLSSTGVVLSKTFSRP